MQGRIKTAFIILSLLGLAISVYLTAYHYAGIPLVCSDKGVINCNNVLNSPISYIFGIPIAVYGIPFFAVELALSLFTRNRDAVMLWNVLGIAMVAYFVYLEYRIGNICIWCTSVHVIVVALLGLSAYQLVKDKR